jgi:hypothetical protein
LQRRRGAGRSAGREAARLRDHLDENHGWYDRMTREVPVKEEIVRARRSPAEGPFPRHEVHHFVDQAHRRLVRQQIHVIHAQYSDRSPHTTGNE